MHRLIRPGPLGSKRDERESAKDPTTGHQREGEVRPDPLPSEGVLVTRRRDRELVKVRNNDALLMEESLDHPGDILARDDLGLMLDPGHLPRMRHHEIL